MTEETIFSPDQGQSAAPAASQEAAPAPTAPAIPTELAGIVGEGKKFKTLEDYNKGYENSQQFIETLKSETAQLRDELAKRKAAEDLLKDIRSEVSQPQPTSQGVEVNQDVVSSIVKQQLDSIKAKDTADANAALVLNAFKEAYGDKVDQEAQRIATESGLTLAQLQDLTYKSPQAVLNLAGLKGNKKAPSTSFTSDVNTQALSSNQQPAQLNAKAVNYGKSSDVADAMRRAREIVNAKLNS
jgi:hypothetical protein